MLCSKQTWNKKPWFLSVYIVVTSDFQYHCFRLSTCRTLSCWRSHGKRNCMAHLSRDKLDAGSRSEMIRVPVIIHKRHLLCCLLITPTHHWRGLWESEHYNWKFTLEKFSCVVPKFSCIVPKFDCIVPIFSRIVSIFSL